MEPSDKFFHGQENELTKYANVRAKRFIDRLEMARKELEALLASESEFKAQRVARLAQQIDLLSAQVRQSFSQFGTPIQDLGTMAQLHLQTSTTMLAGFDIAVSLDVLTTPQIIAFSELTLSQVKTLVGYEFETIKNVLFSKVGVRGLQPRAVAKQLAGRGGQFEKRFGQIENILRTETSTVYNDQSLQGIQAINEEHGLGLRKRIIESIDRERNHPISQIINGMVQEADKPFKVAVGAVQARAAAMGRKSFGGILWTQQGGYYVGDRLPAHYRERGICVPTLKEVTPASPKGNPFKSN